VTWPLPPPGAARRRRRRAPRSYTALPARVEKSEVFRARARATSAVVIPMSRAKWTPVLKTLRRGALPTLPCGVCTLRFWCEHWLFKSQHEHPATLYIRSHNFSTATTLAARALVRTLPSSRVGSSPSHLASQRSYQGALPLGRFAGGAAQCSLAL
jgi:hypothetical protein